MVSVLGLSITANSSGPESWVNRYCPVYKWDSQGKVPFKNVLAYIGCKPLHVDEGFVAEGEFCCCCCLANIPDDTETGGVH